MHCEVITCSFTAPGRFGKVSSVVIVTWPRRLLTKCSKAINLHYALSQSKSEPKMSMVGTDFSHGATSRAKVKRERKVTISRIGNYRRNVCRALLDGKITYQQAIKRTGASRRKAHKASCTFDPISTCGLSVYTKQVSRG
jgi:hypothetical protein